MPRPQCTVNYQYRRPIRKSRRRAFVRITSFKGCNQSFVVLVSFASRHLRTFSVKNPAPGLSRSLGQIYTHRENRYIWLALVGAMPGYGISLSITLGKAPNSTIYTRKCACWGQTIPTQAHDCNTNTDHWSSAWLVRSTYPTLMLELAQEIGLPLHEDRARSPFGIRRFEPWILQD